MIVSVFASASMVGTRRMRVRVRTSIPRPAATLGPFVGLRGYHGVDEADDGVPVGEDPHGIGAAADRRSVT